MAAPTNTYCAWATGNDYKGASFTDGAYTSATKTLTKAGAFAATKVGHWLYLESNDGGSIVAGYYKVADASGAPNSVVLATDAGAGVDDDAAKCTQADGSTTKPWRSVQGALDLITRDATNGDQINVKAGVGQVQVNSAALALTTYGAPAEGAPLILRGCTTAANDGGMAEIDCGGATMWASSTSTDLGMVDLQCHTFGNNDGIVLYGARCFAHHCNVHKGASTPSGKSLFKCTSRISDCYVHDAGTSGVGISDYRSTVINCYVHNCATGLSGTASVTGSLVRESVTAGITGCYGPSITGNAVYHSGGSTGTGIAALSNTYIANNIVVGYSGAGGKGIAANKDTPLLGHNAFYNNTANYGVFDVYVDLTANDVALAADPFTDAANGDFSLTAAAKAALRGVGWPAAYLGAHANTDGHVTIGAIQYGEDETAAAVYPAAGDVEDGVAYGPTGADYTGTVTLPAAEDVETGVQYGAGGTEFTGTLAGVGGGGPVVGSRIVRGLGAV